MDSNRFKTVAHVIFPVIILILLSGCWDRRELDELSIVSGVGIDWDSAKQEVLIYAQVLKPSQMQSGQSGGGGNASVLVQSEDTTVFKALRSAAFRNSRKLNFTHNEVLVLGKNAAKRGISPFLDLFIRDPEPRPTQKVLVADGDVKKIMEAKPQIEKASAMEMESLVENYSATSEVQQVLLQDLNEILLSKTTSATLPIIKLTKAGKTELLQLDGTAVFRKDKWIGRMNHRQTRGLLWITGKVKSGAIPVVFGSEKVSVEIIHASGKVQPELIKDKMTVRVNVRIEGNVGDQMNGLDVSKSDMVEKLERQTARVVRREISSAIVKAKALHTDVFGFGEAFYRRYPKEWQTMEAKWTQLFPEIIVKAKVNVVIRRVGEITKP